jgi:hypothetical protein
VGGHLRRPPHCAAQSRERPQPPAQVLVRTPTPTPRDSRAGGLVGDVATAGPSGVRSAPRAALPHSGGVRKHRRYVFAPLIPRVMPHQVDSSGLRVAWKVRVGRFHRVGSCVAGPRRPHPRLVPAHSAGKCDLRRASLLPGSMNHASVELQYPKLSGGATYRRPVGRQPRLQGNLGGTLCRGAEAGFLGDQGRIDPRSEALYTMCSQYLLNFTTSQHHGSCAPKGDGALRRAGGAV